MPCLRYIGPTQESHSSVLILPPAHWPQGFAFFPAYFFLMRWHHGFPIASICSFFNLRALKFLPSTECPVPHWTLPYRVMRMCCRAPQKFPLSSQLLVVIWTFFTLSPLDKFYFSFHFALLIFNPSQKQSLSLPLSPAPLLTWWKSCPIPSLAVLNCPHGQGRLQEEEKRQ